MRGQHEYQVQKNDEALAKTRLTIRDDVEALTQSLQLRIAVAKFPDGQAYADMFRDEITDYEIPTKNGLYPAKSIWERFTKIGWEFLEQERLNVIDLPSHKEEIGRARYVDYLLDQARKLEDIEKTIKANIDAIVMSFLNFIETLPQAAFTWDLEKKHPKTQHLATMPLLDLIPDLAEQILLTVSTVSRPQAKELGLFADFRKYLDNIDQKNDGKYSDIRAFKGSPTEMLDIYLGKTPFRSLFDVQVPFDVPLSKQLEHSMIAAGSRYGKSQLIGSIISTHLKSDDPPGMIILDSTGDFLKKITRLAVFEPGGRLASRLLVIDPAQVPQLNMFDISNIRAKGYGESDMEQIEGDVINLFEYVFRAIGSDLTPQQITATSFCIRLLLSMPGSSIETLVMLLEIPGKKFSLAPPDIQQAIEKLDANAQRYFKNQFFSDGMHATRTGVANRIYNVIKEPSFLRMFTGKNRIDFFEAMQQGKIIVVNTNKSLLQPKPSALFGRYVIARVMSAAFERSTIADMSKRRPCLLIIDEAQEYFDDSIETLLNQIGKFRLGICIAFQNFAQLNDKLRASVIGSTSVKYAGGLIGTEAHMIAREMRTTDDFILAQVKDSADPPQWANFAVRVSSLYEHAVSITVPFYSLENMPKMTDAQYAELLRANKAAVSPAKTEAAPAPPSPVQEPIIEKPAAKTTSAAKPPPPKEKKEKDLDEPE